jgi:microcystin-dependent protein
VGVHCEPHSFAFVAKTIFAPGRRVTAAFLNALQNLTFDGADEDGHYPRLTNSALSTEPGNLLPEFEGLRDALRVTPKTGTQVEVNAGAVTLGNGTSVVVPKTTLTLPSDGVRVIFVDAAGTLQQSGAAPSTGVLLARVATSSGAISGSVVDLRNRIAYQVAPIVVEAQPSFVMPSGATMPFAGTTLPGGWLWCDGAELLRSQYPALAQAVGNTYGLATNPATHFRVPLIEAGRSVVQGGVGFAPGSKGGQVSTTLSVANLPAHNHAVTDPGHAHSVIDPGHNHGTSDPGHGHRILATAGFGSDQQTDPLEWTSTAVTGETGGSEVYRLANGDNVRLIEPSPTGITNQASGTGVGVNGSGTGITVGSVGSGQAIDNMSPWIALPGFIIKV